MTREQAQKKVDEFVKSYIEKHKEKYGTYEPVGPYLCGALQEKLKQAYMEQEQ